MAPDRCTGSEGREEERWPIPLPAGTAFLELPSPVAGGSRVLGGEVWVVW